MQKIIQPKHFGFYKQQADDMLDALDGEPLEVVLRRLILEYCSAPTVAQYHIDAFVNALPHYDRDPVLDAVYALQTLVRTRQAVADIMSFGNYGLTAMNEALFMQNELQSSTGQASNAREQIFHLSTWSDPCVQLMQDVQRQPHRQTTLYNDPMSTMDEMKLELSDQLDPIQCFRIATRRLSILLLQTCTGRSSRTQLKAILQNDFQRLAPVFYLQPYDQETLKSVALGLVTDMNALPPPEDQYPADVSEE